MSHPAIPADFLVSDLIRDSATCGIYTLLFYLNHKSHHAGVRDFLTNQLYQRDEEEIECILPQLCHLFMVWSPEVSGALGDFFNHLCSHSIHFTVKILWTLRAQQFYCPSAAQRESMERLIASCEMALINQKVFGVDGVMRKRRKTRKSMDAHTGSRPRTPEPDVRQAETAPSPTSPNEVYRPTPVTPGGGEASPTSSEVQQELDVPPLPRPSPETIAEAARTIEQGKSHSRAASSDHVFAAPFPVGYVANPAAEEGAAPAATAGPMAPLQGVMYVVDTVFGIGHHESHAPNDTAAAAPAGADPSETHSSTSFVIRSSSASPPPGASNTVPASSSDSSAPVVLTPPAEPLTPGTVQVAAADASVASVLTVASPELPASSSDSPSGHLSVSAASSPSRGRGGSFACSAAHQLSIDDLFLLASSNVRADYFQGIVRLLESFSRISSALVKLPQASRNKKLRAALRDLEPSARGLYFPTSATPPRHYRILRFLPDETFILNSRDKAPFLFHFEVQYTRSASYYDSDLYLGFKSKEQIIREAMELHHCTGCKAINAEKIKHIERRKEREQEIEEQERIHPLPKASDPNPLATVQSAQSQAAAGASVVAPSPSNGATAAATVSMDALQLDAKPTNSSVGAPPGRASSAEIEKSSSTPRGEPPHQPMSATHAKRPSMMVTSTGASLTLSMPRPIVSLHKEFDSLSIQAFGESFSARRARVQAASRYHATMQDTDVMSLIYKHGDDCRQEVMAMQFLTLFDRAFRQAGLPLYLHPYCVLLTSANSGLIETVKDAISIDSLKKNVSATGHGASLATFFHYYHGLRGPEAHERALKNFVESMAAYSVLSFLLQIKDRHNGNLMMLQSGQVVHIDFGFILSNSPGGNVNFESAPFKLTTEFVEVMGGESSEMFSYFKLLVIRGYLEARKHAYPCLLLLEVLSKQSKMACWAAGIDATLLALKDRFQLHASEEQCVEYAYGIVEQSIDNWRTVQYDSYQRITNGIM